MKKIYLIILLISSINAIGQKYKFTMSWDPLQQVGGYYKLLGTGGYQIDYYSQNNNGQIHYKDYELQLNANEYLSFELGLDGCNDPYHQLPTFFITDLMQGYNSSEESCGGRGEISDFRPTEIVLNSGMILEYPQGNPPHYTICGGEQLNMYATILNKPTILPKNYYPPQAFHWQYSLDNKNSWINVPDKILQEGILKNNPDYNTPTLITNTMEQIIGANHKIYYNSIIYFRLGGIVSFASLTHGVLYSPCTPVVTNLEYLKPDCSKDTGSVIITFDRGLLLPNEELRYVKLLKKGDPQYINNLSTQPILNNFTGNTLIFPNIPSGLANGEYYFTYQAYIGSGNSGIPKGIMDSAGKTFTFVKVENLVTSISKIVDTSCYGSSDGSLVLNVKGGTPKSTGLKYNYFVDNNPTSNVIEETDALTGSTIATISGFSAKSDYKIKVTDEKGCNETP